MNEQVMNQVFTFAKINRVNKSKLMEFVESILPIANVGVRKELKNVGAMVRIEELAKANGGIVTLTMVRDNGIKSADYMVNLMVMQGKMIRIASTKEGNKRGRPTATFELV